MTPFKLHRAKSLDEAAKAFKAAEEGRFLASNAWRRRVISCLWAAWQA
jgi:CO/xanthine dehydrogenase FAD-binding subunit